MNALVLFSPRTLADTLPVSYKHVQCDIHTFFFKYNIKERLKCVSQTLKVEYINLRLIHKIEVCYL